MIISTLIKSALATTLLVSALTTAATAKDGVLRIGTEGDAPKFSMADPSGNVTGFDADIANGICAELKLKCEFVVQAFSSLVPSMDSDRFDVIISGLSITDERAKKIDYSIPYATTPQYFVVAKDSPLAKLTTLAEVEKGLSGKSVGVVTGTTYAKFVQKKIPSADLKTYDATTQQLADLSTGRIDAAYTDSPTVMDFLATPDGANFAKVEVKVMAMDDPDTLGKGMGVGMKKGNTELKTKIDTALCKMIDDGQVKKASMQWFQDDYTIPCKK